MPGSVNRQRLSNSTKLLNKKTASVINGRGFFLVVELTPTWLNSYRLNSYRINFGSLCKDNEISYSHTMSVESIVSLIDAELQKLLQARALIAAAGRVNLKKVKAAKTAAKPARQRVLSAEARKRIADAQRKRWAAQKGKNE